MAVLPVTAMAMPPVLPASDVKDGMTGTAYTVIDNSGRIEPFRVDVVGIVDRGRGASRMIMAKASGPMIEQVGGVLQGMSGSPVYIDGKLVGAVAAGIKEMTPYTFFITPIEEMLPLWNMPDTKARAHAVPGAKKPGAAAGQPAQKPKEPAPGAASPQAAPPGDGEPKDQAKPAQKDSPEKKAKKDKKDRKDRKGKHPKPDREREAAGQPKDPPKPKDTQEPQEPPKHPPQKDPQQGQAPGASGHKDGTPGGAELRGAVWAGGFGQEGLSFLGTQLAPFGMDRFYAAGASPAADTTSYQATLEPGSSMGVAIVYGDFYLGATGTVTAVDGKRVLGFGHSFLHQGNVNFFMTDADVVGTISGQSNGLKVATIGNIIGRVNQDREAGIAGILGTFPEVVPVRVTVKDNALSREESYSARIAYNEALLPQLSASIAYAALSRVADSLDGSTATVRFAIRTNAAEDGKIERSNMFYNVADVGQAAVLELGQAMDILCSNTEETSDILDVQVGIVLDQGRRTASIVSAVPDKTKVKPGETVNFKTTIKPYRQEKEVLTIPYTVPRTQPEGALNLDVRGGTLVPLTQATLLQQAGVNVVTEEGHAQTVKERLKGFAGANRNNEIIIAPGAAPEPPSKREQRKAIRAALKAAREAEAEGAEAAPKETKFETKYIIENVVHATLQVEKK